MSTGEKSVVVAYAVIFAAVLAYVVIIAFKLDRLEREVASRTDALTGRKAERPDKCPPPA